MRRSLAWVWFSLLLASAFPDQAVAGQVTITLDIDSSMDMVQPESIPNSRAHSHWTIVLEEGGAIAENITSNNGRASREYRSDNQLGRTFVGAPQHGSQVWHVQSSHSLTRTQTYAQNIRTMTVTITGSSCHLSVVDRLKPGFSLYTFPSASTGQTGYFANYHVVGASCSIR